MAQEPRDGPGRVGQRSPHRRVRALPCDGLHPKPAGKVPCAQMTGCTKRCKGTRQPLTPRVLLGRTGLSCCSSSPTWRQVIEVQEAMAGPCPSPFRRDASRCRRAHPRTHVQYTYIQTYRQTDVHAYIHTYIHTYIQTYIHTHIHTYIIHIYIHTHIHTYIRPYIRTYTHTYTAYTHPYIHTYIHTHIYIHTYIRTYIHTYSSSRMSRSAAGIALIRVSLILCWGMWSETGQTQ